MVKLRKKYIMNYEKRKVYIVHHNIIYCKFVTITFIFIHHTNRITQMTSVLKLFTAKNLINYDHVKIN